MQPPALRTRSGRTITRESRRRPRIRGQKSASVLVKSIDMQGTANVLHGTLSSMRRARAANTGEGEVVVQRFQVFYAAMRPGR